MWRCTGQPTVGSPDYHCLRSEDTIFTSIIKFQYSNQDKNHAKEKPINHFQRSLRVQSCSCCYENTRDSSPLTCVLCLGILIKKNAKSGSSGHENRSGFIWASVNTPSPSRQAFLSKQLCCPIRMTSQSQPSSAARRANRAQVQPLQQQTESRMVPSAHLSSRGFSGLRSY